MSALPGIYSALRPGSEGTGVAVSEHDSLQEGCRSTAGEDSTVDAQRVQETLGGSHWGGQPRSSRMGKLLPLRLSACDVPGRKPFCAMSVPQLCAAPEPTAVQTLSPWREPVWRLETLWVDLFVRAALSSTPCVYLEARDCRRAGCGKSARPVRRGGGCHERHGLRAFCHDARKGRYYGSLWPKHLVSPSLLYWLSFNSSTPAKSRTEPLS